MRPAVLLEAALEVARLGSAAALRRWRTGIAAEWKGDGSPVTAADREAVDLYGFTSLINRSLDEDGRRRIVKMMWEMVYADGRMNEFEDNVVWRASDLLGISQRDRVEMRREVAAMSKSRDDA